MIAVVAAMGGEVESDRQAFLPGGEIAPIERIGILGRREAGILPDGPRLGDVHGRVGAAQERRDARIGIEAVEAVESGGVIGIFDGDALGRLPRLNLQRRGRRRRRAKRVGIAHLRKIRNAAHCPFLRSPVLRQNIVSGGQCRQCIAALVNEGLHAGRVPGGFPLAGTAGEKNVFGTGRF